MPMQVTRWSYSSFRIAALWVCVAMAGCATQTKHEAMVATGFAVAKKSPQTVSVNVLGGKETEGIGKPQISDAEFTRALVDSINASKVFSTVVPGPAGNYLLTVQMFDLTQPTFGLTYVVKMEAGWTLKRADTGKAVWQESIASQHTATTADAFVAVERLRIATEGAARNNIAAGLAKISQLDL
jgi:hypothetical protein